MDERKRLSAKTGSVSLKMMLKIAFTVYVLLIVTAATGMTETGSSQRLNFSEQVFDFGHVGIDFKLFHTFYIVNNGTEPVAIKSASASCDCSHVRLSDSLIQPKDTVFFHLDFLTRNFYGPTTKSMEVVLDDPEYPEMKFYYLSDIGRWFGGLKPEPISLFFLPGAGPRQVTLPNQAFSRISWEVHNQSDSTFKISVDKPVAGKGEKLALTVEPRDNLKKGTYLSNFTMYVTTDPDAKPVILTIPVKIVVY